jgi:hypothetical protein
VTDDDFIGLPPGMLDSGTFKAPIRTERPRTEKPDIVFVPTVPGMPVPAPNTDGADGSDSTLDGMTRREPSDDVAVPGSGAEHTVPTAEVEVGTTAMWTLTLADGTTATLTGSMLLGRDPAQLAHWSGATLLPLADTTKSVSKTHAGLEVDGSGLWVHDLDSTNGVWVVVGEDATEVAPGRRVAVPANAVIELGEYVVRVAQH